MVRVSSSQRGPHRDLLTAGSSEEWDHFGAGRDGYFTELRCPPSRVWQPQMHHVMISVQDGGDNAPEECDCPRSGLSCWVKVRVEPRLEPGRWTGDTNWARHRITTTLPPSPQRPADYGGKLSRSIKQPFSVPHAVRMQCCWPVRPRGCENNKLPSTWSCFLHCTSLVFLHIKCIW